MQKLKLRDETVMEQPDVLNSIQYYQSAFVADSQISQIYTFYLSGQKSGFFYAVPDGSVDLVFYRNRATREQGVKLIGPARSLTASYVDFKTGTDYAGVRFKPCYALDFGDFLSTEAYDRIVDLGDGQGAVQDLIHEFRSKAPLKTKLSSARTAVSRYFCVRDDRFTRIAHPVIDYFLTHKDSVRAADLGQALGYTPYYLNKVFHTLTGYTIGRFHALIRLHNVLNVYEKLRTAADCRKPDYAAIAQELGFSDQGHMIREFRKYVGETPDRYWRRYYQT
jgi:AraC-like DNA-binding protein